MKTVSRLGVVLPLVVAAVTAGGVSSAFAKDHRYQIDYTFKCDATSGAYPEGNLIADKAGNLYGATYAAGAGFGTVFRLTRHGALTVLYTFQGKYHGDGANPAAGLITDKAGNFYGTTFEGGTDNDGTVFELTPSGTETVLHSFTGGSDGSNPLAGLIMDKKGNLYGTTTEGGPDGYSGGTVFEVTPSGIKTVLYTFTGGSDGGNPIGGLLADGVGNLYGTASTGGSDGNGTVYRIAPGGSETTLHTFTGGSDGGSPRAALIADAAGNLYGTTYAGGSSGYGVVFEITPNGTETVLHSFIGSDGANPEADLILDGAGDFYSTTYAGGTGDYGTIFKLAPNGTETVLYSMLGGNDSTWPIAGVIKDSAGEKGYLFGTATAGGVGGGLYQYGCGTVFELKK